MPITAGRVTCSNDSAPAIGSWLPVSSKMRTYIGPSVLVIDELGYLPMDHASAHWIFQVVSRRHERGSIVLSSNRGFSDWGQVFADQAVAVAILDRLLHHATAPRHGVEHQGQELPDAQAPSRAGQGEGRAYDLRRALHLWVISSLHYS